MSTGGGEPPAGRKAAPDQPSELPGDIWSMPPVEAALAVTGFRTRANQAIYGAKLRQIERLLGPDHGRRRFMDVVNKLRTDLRDGGDRFIATADRPRVLTGALRDEIERIQQRKGGGPDGGL